MCHNLNLLINKRFLATYISIGPLSQLSSRRYRSQDPKDKNKDDKNQPIPPTTPGGSGPLSSRKEALEGEYFYKKVGVYRLVGVAKDFFANVVKFSHVSILMHAQYRALALSLKEVKPLCAKARQSKGPTELEDLPKMEPSLRGGLSGCGPLSSRKNALESEYFYNKSKEDIEKMKDKKEKDNKKK